MFKTLKSLLAGLIAGTALGVLFAPKKGEETRKDMKKELAQGGSGLGTVKNTLVGISKEIGESQSFQKGTSKAKKFLKENIPAKHRKQAFSAVKKAKSTVNEILAKFRPKS